MFNLRSFFFFGDFFGTSGESNPLAPSAFHSELPPYSSNGSIERSLKQSAFAPPPSAGDSSTGLSLFIALFLLPSLLGLRDCFPSLIVTHRGPGSISPSLGRYYSLATALTANPPSLFSFISFFSGSGVTLDRHIFSTKFFRSEFPLTFDFNPDSTGVPTATLLPSSPIWTLHNSQIHFSLDSNLALFWSLLPISSYYPLSLFHILGDLLWLSQWPLSTAHGDPNGHFLGHAFVRGQLPQSDFLGPSPLSNPHCQLRSFYYFLSPTRFDFTISELPLPSLPILPTDYISFHGRFLNPICPRYFSDRFSFVDYLHLPISDFPLSRRIAFLAPSSFRNFGVSLHQRRIFNHFMFRGLRSRALDYFETFSMEIARSIRLTGPGFLAFRRHFQLNPPIPSLSGPLSFPNGRPLPFYLAPFGHIYQFSVGYLNFPFRPLLFRRGATRTSVLSLSRRNRDFFRLYLWGRHIARSLPFRQIFSRYLFALLDIVLRPEDSLYGRMLENSYFHILFRRMDLSRHLFRHRRRMRILSQLPFGGSLLRRSWWNALPIAPARSFVLMRTALRTGSSFGFFSGHLAPTFHNLPNFSLGNFSLFPFQIGSGLISLVDSLRPLLTFSQLHFRFSTLRNWGLTLRSLAQALRRFFEGPLDQRPYSFRPYRRLYRLLSRRTFLLGWVSPMRSLRGRVRRPLFPRLIHPTLPVPAAPLPR